MGGGGVPLEARLAEWGVPRIGPLWKRRRVLIMLRGRSGRRGGEGDRVRLLLPGGRGGLGVLGGGGGGLELQAVGLQQGEQIHVGGVHGHGVSLEGAEELLKNRTT